MKRPIAGSKRNEETQVQPTSKSSLKKETSNFKIFYLLGFFICLIVGGFFIYSSQNETVEIKQKVNPEKERIFSPEELSKYDGSNPNKPIYLAIMGQVFDVSDGKAYQKGGSYSFFAGKDATRAFITGDFKNDLTDSLEGLDYSSIKSAQEWLQFYLNSDKYRYVGKVNGYFYGPNGEPLSSLDEVEKSKKIYEENMKLEEQDREKYPLCNSKFKSGVGGEVWCSEKSGGKQRSWKGFPRLRTRNGKSFCICLNPEIVDPDPSITLYPNCDPQSTSCKIS